MFALIISRQLLMAVALILLFNNVSLSQKAKTPETSVNLQKKLALVIGNNKYPAMPLNNPVNDVRLIAEKLQGLGFKVIKLEDLSYSNMLKAIEDFSKELSQNGIGLFYYAGHGSQISGKNFLIPTDFKEAKNETDFIKQTIPLENVLTAMSGKTGLNIIVLDACRNNADGFVLPDTTQQGLAEIKNAPSGTFISFSTAPGKTASDGSGKYSPFAESLANNLLLRPSRLEDIFIRTRIQVDRLTGGTQEPWETGSLRTIFYFTSDELAPAGKTSTTVESVAFQLGLRPATPAGIKLQPFSIVVPVLNNSGTRTSTLNGKGSLYFESAGGANMEMVEIPGGRFAMGSSAAEVSAAYKDAKRYNDEVSQESIAAEMPQHLVKVPGFFMSKYEITQGQWRAVMGSLPNIPTQYRGDNLPVVNVSWQKANEFCEKLSQVTGRTYRLPSEAEWEYAARAGTSTPFAFGDSINSSLVNFMATAPYGLSLRGTYRQNLVVVGQLNAANNFGLYDMHGNVWEWCADNWHDDYNGAPNDGSAWMIATDERETEDEDEEDPSLIRVIRGGSWDSIGNNCRSAYRRKQPGIGNYGSTKIGFRVVSN